NVARDPRKRREYLQNLCGLPDNQVTLEETPKDKIVRKENAQLKKKEICQPTTYWKPHPLGWGDLNSLDKRGVGFLHSYPDLPEY
ncbi:MAG: hypothetical protein Q7V05_14040, partial [Methanoregula sp.]|nr:hypothetical protein [Methanoregula sp.]